MLLAAGDKGRRLALPNARIMIHQPLGGARGQATDIEIQAARDPSPEGRHHRHPRRTRPARREDQIHKDIDRDFYLSAAQAKEYGLIDDVLPPKQDEGCADERER